MSCQASRSCRMTLRLVMHALLPPGLTVLPKEVAICHLLGLHLQRCTAQSTALSTAHRRSCCKCTEPVTPGLTVRPKAFSIAPRAGVGVPVPWPADACPQTRPVGHASNAEATVAAPARNIDCQGMAFLRRSLVPRIGLHLHHTEGFESVQGPVLAKQSRQFCQSENLLADQLRCRIQGRS
jgi:hypothetical protein